MEQSSLGWWRRRRSCSSPPWSSASSTLLSALSIVSSTLSACLGLRKCLHIYCFLHDDFGRNTSKMFFSGFRAIWIGMIAGITAYYAIGLKNVYDDMSDAPAAGFSLFLFMIVYLFEDMSFAEGLLLSLFSCLAVRCYLLNSCCHAFSSFMLVMFIFTTCYLLSRAVHGGETAGQPGLISLPSSHLLSLSSQTNVK